MINIILCGANGKMGHTLAKIIAEDNNANVVCGVDINTEKYDSFPIYSHISEYKGKADVIIDFSHPSAVIPLLSYAMERKLPAVISTTGLTAEHKEKILEASKVIPVFHSANMSLGVNLLVELVKKAATVLSGKFDIEIIEKHHNKKIDAPSGTALMIADAVNEAMDSSLSYVYERQSKREKREANELGIHSVRGGTIVGEHDVIFAGNDEIITVSHTALSKKVFAEGSLKAAEFIADMPAGLYDMNSVIGQKG